MKHTTKAAGGCSVFSYCDGAEVVLCIKRPGKEDAEVRLHPAEADAVQWALMHQADEAERKAGTSMALMLAASRGDHIVSARAI